MSSIIQDSNPQNIDLLAAYFVRRREPNFAWGNVASMFSMLPGLRGFWPMSSWDNAFAVYDLSGQGRTLTNVNTTALHYEGLAPKATFNGTTQYLRRADEAGLDITNIGLTVAGWFWADAHIVTNQTAMAKWLTTGNQRSHQLLFRRSGLGNDNSFGVSTDGINTVQVTSGVTYSAGAWIFLAGRWIPSTEVALFVGNAGTWSKYTNAVGVPATVFNGTADFTIGANGDPAEYLAGKASSSGLTHKALPDYMIWALYDHTRALFGV